MTTEEIYEHYRFLVRKYVPDVGFVLKTDCFNEAEGGEKDISDLLDAKKTTYVELNPAMVEQAKSKHPERYFVCGDIRELQFGDETFSMVIDLSTIDHIPLGDVKKAIKEYYRVLKPGGRLLLVAWCSDKRREEPINWGGLQYFLYEPELLNLLKTTWIHVTHHREFHRSGDLYLVEIIGEKI